MDRLTTSPMTFVKDELATRCTMNWDADNKEIVVSGPGEKECAKIFPTEQEDRLKLVRDGAFEDDLRETLESADDLESVLAALLALCDVNLGGVAPDTCKERQLQLVRDAQIVASANGQDCVLTYEADDVTEGIVVKGGASDCSTALTGAISGGLDKYEQGKPTKLEDVVRALYRECDDRAEATASDDDPIDVAACWEAASDLAVDARYQRVVTDSDTCRAVWDSTRSNILLTGSDAACDQTFPRDAGRSDVVVQEHKRHGQLTSVGGASNFGEALTALFAFCDRGDVGDPEKCKEEARDLLKKATVEKTTDDGCAVAYREGTLVITVGQGCSQAFPIDKVQQAAEIEQAEIEYQRKSLLDGTADPAAGLAALFALCDSGTAGEVVKCKADSRAFLQGAQIVRSGSSCKAVASFTGGQLTITIGERCGDAFPEDPATWQGVIDRAVIQYQAKVLLTGVAGPASALDALYAFCDTGAGGDPATCKQESAVQLKDVQINRSGSGCAATTSVDGGKLTITVGKDCSDAFPNDPAAWTGLIDQAAAQYQRKAVLRGATDFGTAVAALYAFCDSGAGGDPAKCKQDSEALLKDVQVVRTGTSCTAEISTGASKPTIVVGPSCGEAFPDDAAARAGQVAQAVAGQQRTAVLRGATDLTAATKALYAFCDTGAQGDPARCKQESDALLKEVRIVRTGNSCTAQPGTEDGKPTLVVGADCAAAFPDNPTARVAAMQEGAKQYLPSNPKQLEAPVNVPPAGTPPGANPPPEQTPPAECVNPPPAGTPPANCVNPPPPAAPPPPADGAEVPAEKEKTPPVKVDNPPEQKKKETKPAPDEKPKEKPKEKSKPKPQPEPQQNETEGTVNDEGEDN